MSKVAEASEPSMQEILASIRKIISDDDMPDGGLGGDAAKSVGSEDVFAENQNSAAMDDEPMVAEIAVGSEKAEAPEEVNIPVEDDGGDCMFDPPEDGDEDPLELTPDMEIELEALAPVEHLEDDLVFDEAQPDAEAGPEPESIPVPVPSTIEATPVPKPVLPRERILSDSAGAAVGAVFGQLNGLLLDKESRTVEDLIRDMLQPMLKMWLDDNLPTLVEKIVREEVERVSRGR